MQGYPKDLKFEMIISRKSLIKMICRVFHRVLIKGDVIRFVYEVLKIVSQYTILLLKRKFIMQM